MKILLLNDKPLNFKQATSLLKVLKNKYPEIFISEFLAFAQSFRNELRNESKDVLVFATALQSQYGFSGPYTLVKIIRNFPMLFLEQNNEYSLVEYS